MPHIQHLNTAKEGWDALTELFIGNESMRRNIYDALSNEVEGFYMLDGEDMYRRLKSIATTFRNHGASHVDDAWIKRKYVSALMPFEPTDLKSLQGRHNYHLMTSNEVMQEMAAFKVAAKNAEDARARAMGMQKGVNMALKTSVIDHDEYAIEGMDCPEDIKRIHGQYLALYARNFWKDPAKAKAELERKSGAYGRKDNGPKLRTCLNCGERLHFVAECPYQSREDNGGRLIFKDKSKAPRKKQFVKKNAPFKKQPKIVLVAQEEYSSGSEDEDKDDSSQEVAAIATTSTSTSLFDSPNENIINKNATCLMARSSEVTSSNSSFPKAMIDMDDPTSLKVKEEIISLDYFYTNLQGEHKVRFEALMDQLAQNEALLEEKGRIEREDAMEIASLKNALEEEEEARVSLEGRLESMEESHEEIVTKLVKERDNAVTKAKKLKKERIDFGAAHDRLSEELEKLDNAHKALKNEFSILNESHDQLQSRLAEYDTPSSSNSTYNNKKNSSVEKEVIKDITTQDKGVLDEVLGKQRSNHGKEGLGYVTKSKKKKTKKNKTKNVQLKTSTAKKVVTKDKTNNIGFAGSHNPNYELFCDDYGDVYAYYVGPFDEYIAWSIWVPKTLVTNMKGPIEKWVPKTKK